MAMPGRVGRNASDMVIVTIMPISGHWSRRGRSFACSKFGRYKKSRIPDILW